MKKLLLILLLIASIVNSLILVNSYFGTVQASTEFNGAISIDTTWTKVNSPYTLSGPVLVNNGVTLTIEPGVFVNLNGYYIRVDGTLHARSSNTEYIEISGAINFNAGVIFTESSRSWDEQTGSGSIVENTILDFDIINSSPKILNSIVYNPTIHGGKPIFSNNTVVGKALSIFDGTPLIANNFFNGSQINIYGGSPIIVNNNITYTYNESSVGWHLPQYGIVLDGNSTNAYISDNTISKHALVGIRVISGNATIQRNLIMDNDYGMQIEKNGKLIIQNNTITQNYHRGIFDTATSVPPTIIYNNFLKDDGTLPFFYKIDLGSSLDGNNAVNPNNIIAAYNWWGTTDLSLINQTIYDNKNNFNIGTVTFVPILTSPNPQAMPDPNSSIQTPYASPSPSSPTPTSSSSASLNPTTSPDQAGNQAIIQSGPNWLEIATLLLLGIIAVLLVAVMVSVRKNRLRKQGV